ncbi:MAG TPA: sugar phosphate isomerase/epimerase, partial [Puia sp.]|nr:sugar phosphate isomerase/epimerase [Puia sp.]
MHNRRVFLKNTGAMALGGLLLSKKASAFMLDGMAAHPVGLQLFTLFSVMDKDVPGSLKKVAEIGYKEIESAFSMKGGYYGLKPKEFAALVKDSGLSWQSHHVLGAPFKMPPGGIKIPGGDTTRRFNPPPMRNLKENHQQLVDEAASGGVNYLVCANISHGSTADIKEAVTVLNKSGEACKKAGIVFAYHNHTSEFDTVDGVIPYDVFLSETGADTVKMELDLGWATKAGKDPVELFKQHPGRFPLWHVKDLDKNKE